ncbi:hypothetical protein GN156_30105 [bacterium LRH843]|nr:hypothetical protein [bacterium LRH843]
MLVDLPKDVAQASVPFPAAEPDRASVHPFRPDPETISAAEAMVAHARKPVLYLGGGVPIACGD